MSEEQSTYSANPGKQLVRTVDGWTTSVSR